MCRAYLSRKRKLHAKEAIAAEREAEARKLVRRIGRRRSRINLFGGGDTGMAEAAAAAAAAVASSGASKASGGAVKTGEPTEKTSPLRRKWKISTQRKLKGEASIVPWKQFSLLDDKRGFAAAVESGLETATAMNLI